MKNYLKPSILLSCLAVAMMILAPGASADDRIGDPYTLDSCPISGKKLGSMGDPISIIVDGGREVKVCCGGCKGTVETDTAAVLSKIDAMVIEQQKANFPLETCVVSGEKLGSMGDPINLVINNRHVQICCAGCKKSVEADPAGIIAKLDKAVIAKQGASYNVDKCVISGETLNAKAINMVIGNKLVKICCEGCRDGVNANPAKFFSMIDSGKVEAEGSDHK